MGRFDWITFGEKSKPAVVFLHGWGGGFSSFLFFAKELSKNYFCVVIDANVIFESGKVVCVHDYAKALVDCVNELGLEKFSLIGHSFGGRVIAKAFENLSGRVEKIVLVDVAGLKPRRTLKYRFKKLRFKFAKFLVKLKLIKSEKLLKFGSADYVKLDPTKRLIFKNIVNEDLTICYKKITCPTLIFWGKNDKETPFYMAKKLKKLIKNSAIISTNGGHFSYLDYPNMFLLTCESFLKHN